MRSLDVEGGSVLLPHPRQEFSRCHGFISLFVLHMDLPPGA